MFCFEEAKSYYLQAYSQIDIFTKQDSWIILATMGFIIKIALRFMGTITFFTIKKLNTIRISINTLMDKCI